MGHPCCRTPGRGWGSGGCSGHSPCFPTGSMSHSGPRALAEAWWGWGDTLGAAHLPHAQQSAPGGEGTSPASHGTLPNHQAVSLLIQQKTFLSLFFPFYFLYFFRNWCHFVQLFQAASAQCRVRQTPDPCMGIWKSREVRKEKWDSLLLAVVNC